jgi:hypothetical protein
MWHRFVARFDLPHLLYRKDLSVAWKDYNAVPHYRHIEICYQHNISPDKDPRY